MFAISPRALRLRLRLQSEATSLLQLLDRVRFALARQLMRNTRMGLSEIAAALRYADLPCFSRAFRKWSGMSPSDWRLGQGGGPA